MVRRALRTLFSAEDEDTAWQGRRRIWWQQDDSLDGEAWDGAYDSGTYAQWYDDESYDYYDDGSPWNAYYDDDAGYDWEWTHEEDVGELPIDETNADPAEQQYREAYALANEATRTLTEARDAVRKVRAAPGYFAPESSSGKGIAGSPTSSWYPSGSKGRALGSGKGKSFGPCFICGMNGHSYAQCPDRFAKGKGQFKGKKGYGKGFSKGKKGKGKGFAKSVQFHDLSCLLHPGIYLADATQNSVWWMDPTSSMALRFMTDLFSDLAMVSSCKHPHVLICTKLHWGRSLSMSSVVMLA